MSRGEVGVMLGGCEHGARGGEMAVVMVVAVVVMVVVCKWWWWVVRGGGGNADHWAVDWELFHSQALLFLSQSIFYISLFNVIFQNQRRTS